MVYYKVTCYIFYKFYIIIKINGVQYIYQKNIKTNKNLKIQN